MREAILQAFEKAGGADYLLTVALDDPRTFCGLLGKVLPTQISGPDGGPLVAKVTLRGRDLARRIALTIAKAAIEAQDHVTSAAE